MSDTFKLRVVTLTGAQQELDVPNHVREPLVNMITDADPNAPIGFKFGTKGKGIFIINMRNIATIYIENE